jgi:hypothetical protein
MFFDLHYLTSKVLFLITILQRVIRYYRKRKSNKKFA